MSAFKTLFGIAPEEVQKTCIIAPFLLPQFLKYMEIDTLSKGRIYASSSLKNATFIKAGIGPTFCGDAVLALKETSCENIIFIGSCGLAETALNLKIGDLVCPHQAINMESFTSILHQHATDPIICRPSVELTSIIEKQGAHPVNCLSFGSFMLENENENLLKELSVDVLEMECAAVFAAAKHINCRSAALLIISDLLKGNPLFQQSAKEERAFQESIGPACVALKTIVQTIP